MVLNSIVDSFKLPPPCMLESLQYWDSWFFYAVNRGSVNIVFDWIMPFITSTRNWLPVYVVGLAALAWKGKRGGRECVLLLLLCISISDPLNSRVIKEWVSRERPSHALADVRVLSPDAGGKSFPSSHATNNFAAALILSSFYPNRRLLWYAIAALIAFSRVYVGVHYPLDVIGGALEGTVIAWLLLQLYQRVQSAYRVRHDTEILR